MQTHRDLPRAFAELGVDVPFLRALAKMKFSEPSEIQRAMIPVALEGRDILGQARTGTGKTAAFAIPALQMVDPAKACQVLCLVPTRELAVQVVAEVRRLAEGTGVNSVPVYGGQKVQTQVHLLGRKPHFVVGTPGRVMDLMGRRVLDVSGVRISILDEVDRMLDIGFRDDIRRILSQLPTPRQTVFVSATIDDEIRRLAKQYMREPAEIDVSRDELTVEEVDQVYCSVERYDKYRLLQAILRTEDPKLTIVFCNTKHAARKLTKKLHADGVDAKEIHGDLVQQRREKVMDHFRKHQIRMLVATDLASRGIDVSAISHIINYDLPVDPQVYVHRIGRTARMGLGGRAISFVTRDEGSQLTQIEKLINKMVAEARYDGFTPSPMPDEPMATAPAGPKSRYDQPVFSGATGKAAAPPPMTAPRKTLGSKFRPARGRRR
ncbi:MAG: DEAD/DEAH box helicase [Phycisphaerales bacterium]|nr:DEAD/DEAH box helicase [Phycisphaerales bacterium]